MIRNGSFCGNCEWNIELPFTTTHGDHLCVDPDRIKLSTTFGEMLMDSPTYNCPRFKEIRMPRIY